MHPPYILDSTNVKLTGTIEAVEEERDDEIKQVQELMLATSAYVARRNC